MPSQSVVSGRGRLTELKGITHLGYESSQIWGRLTGRSYLKWGMPMVQAES
jgi:hypothetical protein